MRSRIEGSLGGHASNGTRRSFTEARERKVIDDDGHRLERGKPTAVCDKTLHIYNHQPYAHDVFPIPPYETVPLEAAVTLIVIVLYCATRERRRVSITESRICLEIIVPERIVAD